MEQQPAPQRPVTTTFAVDTYLKLEDIIELPQCDPDDCNLTAVCYIHFHCKCSDVFPFCAYHRDLLINASKSPNVIIECQMCRVIDAEFTVHPIG